MVKGGGGGKAGDHGVDAREGAEQATFSSCGTRTAMDEAGNYGFGTRLPESFYEDFASILEACEIEEEEETSGAETADERDRCRKADERGRNGKPESKEATTTKDEETDTEVGSTASGRNEAKHALRPVEGHETSMHTADERQRVTD